MRKKALLAFIKSLPVAVLITSGNPVFPEMIEQAQISGVPVLRTQEQTSPIMAALIASLNQHLAPRITRHGVLVEVYGEGILLLGDSGVGKSETAIELVKRGHRLIADDAVEIKRVSAKTLVGSAPEIIRHYVELRGIGIVDIRRLFGMGAVKETEKIDLVINLFSGEMTEMERLGLEHKYINILGVEVEHLNLPVAPGRDMCRLVEVAALGRYLRDSGYDMASEFNQRLNKEIANRTVYPGNAE